MSQKKATTKAAKSKVTPLTQAAEQDRIVIDAAMHYTANLAAEEGAFKAKPDSNADFGADKISDRFHRQTKAALTILANTKATGLDAIEAKARAMKPLILDSFNSPHAVEKFGRSLEPLEAFAVMRFAEDVREFVAALRDTAAKAQPTKSAA